MTVAEDDEFPGPGDPRAQGGVGAVVTILPEVRAALEDADGRDLVRVLLSRVLGISTTLEREHGGVLDVDELVRCCEDAV
jgi:hypothetical protein